MGNDKEFLILSNLLTNKEYFTKVMPHLKSEYFTTTQTQLIFDYINEHYITYDSVASYDVLVIAIGDNKKLDPKAREQTIDTVGAIYEVPDEPHSLDWLVDTTESYCKLVAMHNSLIKGSELIRGQIQDNTYTDIAKMIEDTLTVSFNSKIGHDYIEDSDSRFDYYTDEDSKFKIPFGISELDRITDGGVKNATLSMFLAGTHVGKTILLTNIAKNNILFGKNVLYISMELSEEEIGKRIDTLCLDVPIRELTTRTKTELSNRIQNAFTSGHGKLIIKRYSNNSASTRDFRQLLEDLKYKKSFEPDVIFVDYLGLVKPTYNNGRKHEELVRVAQELRQLAVDFDIPVLTAHQLNREGYTSSSPGLENTAGSFDMNGDMDMVFSVNSNPDLKAMGRLAVTDLKNRNAGTSDEFGGIEIGICYKHLRISDVDNSINRVITPQNIPTHNTNNQKANTKDDDIFGTSDDGEETYNVLKDDPGNKPISF